jgi:aspartate 1-decarboxylase
MNIVKRPKPRNFRSGNVCLSNAQAHAISAGDTLTILSYDTGELIHTKVITQAMIDSLDSQGDYYLMTYKEAA